MNVINRFFADEEGATAIVFGLIAALIAVVIIGALTALGTSIQTQFTTIDKSISSSSP